MDSAFVPRWFATPDGGTVYAMTGSDRILEHRRVGRRYRRQVLEVRTYADRLYVASLLDRVQEGLLVSMEQEEYDEAVRNIERLEPMP